ncbi:hypothetical protein E1B28_002300 [Marasmius oreades]|uniref:Uncharacterized protein n=1 Tax=Marasmius oreades TaxID=181124 RepID=A0A9P7RNU8_9AGAR|nr:uncharacterized protein E1B28_002300 [Marasmius oreades]KAG7086338.1 hypothetical protein E1B28_002300 [Marasmius oreades]
MSLSLSTRTYTVIRSKEDNSSISLTLAAPIIHAENLYLQTWGSSFVLANLLHKLEDQLPFTKPRTKTEDDPENTSTITIDVLELGAGTGLVGLSAASILRSSLGRNGAVVLTDLPTIVPSLVDNIKLNEELVGGGTVLCGSLDWNTPNQLVLFTRTGDGEDGNSLTTLTPENKALLIVAADTMYTEDHPRLLSRTIFTWCVLDIYP